MPQAAGKGKSTIFKSQAAGKGKSSIFTCYRLLVGVNLQYLHATCCLQRLLYNLKISQANSKACRRLHRNRTQTVCDFRLDVCNIETRRMDKDPVGIPGYLNHFTASRPLLGHTLNYVDCQRATFGPLL